MERLVLGAGPHWPKIRNDQYHDIFVDIRPFPNIDVVHDLNVIPWPFPDNSVGSISAIHVVEHLRCLVTFMNECWRILSPGGSLYIETPHAGMDVDLEFADPTHVRCYTKHSFINYFTKEGVNNFGYTDKAWCIYHLDVKNNCIIFHGAPIK
jgi:predicted SAM-dependent methyltransferase